MNDRRIIIKEKIPYVDRKTAEYSLKDNILESVNSPGKGIYIIFAQTGSRIQKKEFWWLSQHAL